MIKYTKEMNVFIFFMCHAYKNNKITLKWVEVQYLKTFGTPIPFIRIDNNAKES
jgi:hypothetical protein